VDLPAYAAAWLAEDPSIGTARARARDAGIPAAGPDAGSLLRTLAQIVGARTAVETGTGAGVSALWLLSGMTPDGVLTSIDREPEHQRLARQAFVDAGVPTARARLIAGEAASVLPRLTDGGYDLVHLDCGPSDHIGQFTQALRLVRPGGVVVISGVVRAEPEARTLLEQIGTEHGASCAVLPIGDGMLVMSTSPSPKLNAE
jgi:predicted O-methyltransferase YrrM